MVKEIRNMKRVKAWGNSLVIILDKEDCEIHNIKEDSIIDISKIEVIK